MHRSNTPKGEPFPISKKLRMVKLNGADQRCSGAEEQPKHCARIVSEYRLSAGAIDLNARDYVIFQIWSSARRRNQSAHERRPGNVSVALPTGSSRQRYSRRRLGNRTSLRAGWLMP